MQIAWLTVQAVRMLALLLDASMAPRTGLNSEISVATEIIQATNRPIQPQLPGD